MAFRLGILDEHGLGLKEIQETIAQIEPMPGAKEFLDELRSLTQVIIISDTFTQFAKPLMEKLGWPTLFCNELESNEDGRITGWQMRCDQSKLTTVRALQSAGLKTIAAGDSFNDLGMIKASARQASCSRAPSPSRPTIRRSRRTRSTTSCWPPSRKRSRAKRKSRRDAAASLFFDWRGVICMAVFDRDGDGTASGMEVGRTLAEAGLWHDSLGGSGGGSGSGPRG